MIAVNAVCAETDQEAARLRLVPEAAYKRMQCGVVGTRSSVEEVIAEHGSVFEPTPGALDSQEWSRAISGSLETLAGLLEQFIARVAIDKGMINHLVADDKHVLRPHEYPVLRSYSQAVTFSWTCSVSRMSTSEAAKL